MRYDEHEYKRPGGAWAAPVKQGTHAVHRLGRGVVAIKHSTDVESTNRVCAPVGMCACISIHSEGR